jgi:type II secretory pathway pseudopilin PulG
MLVVAIIGLLAAIAIPKFANMVVKAKEAAVKGKLGSLRSAVSIYYSDNEGFFPTGYLNIAAALTSGGKYLNDIPSISLPNVGSGHSGKGFGQQSMPDDLEFTFAGMAWHYFAPTGHVSVNCTHTDSGHQIWSTW